MPVFQKAVVVLTSVIAWVLVRYLIGSASLVTEAMAALGAIWLGQLAFSLFDFLRYSTEPEISPRLKD